MVGQSLQPKIQFISYEYHISLVSCNAADTIKYVSTGPNAQHGRPFLQICNETERLLCQGLSMRLVSGLHTHWSGGRRCRRTAVAAQPGRCMSQIDNTETICCYAGV